MLTITGLRKDSLMDTTTAVIIVIGLFVLVVIIAFFRFRQQSIAKIKGPFGMSLDIEGKNETRDDRAGITARDVKSHEGGMRAEETTGSGIEIENVDVKKDVVLSSSKAPSPSSQQAKLERLPMGLSAQALSAGGSITIQQFVGNQATLAEQVAFFAQQIGLINPRQDYAKAQFEAYCNVWKSLQSLRLAGDDLWKRADSDRILRFAGQLRQTMTVVREGEIFFEDTDRSNLLGILEVFAEFEAGKGRLIEIHSRGQLHPFVTADIRRQIAENSKYKTEYESLLEDIRNSFKKKLSSQ